MEREKEKEFSNGDIVRGGLLIAFIWLAGVFVHFSHEEGYLGRTFEIAVFFLAYHLILVWRAYILSIGFMLIASVLGVWFTPVWLLVAGVVFKRTLYATACFLIEKMAGSDVVPKGTEEMWLKDIQESLGEMEELENDALRSMLEDIRDIREHVLDLSFGFKYDVVALLAAKTIVLEFALERSMSEKPSNKLWHKIIKGLKFLAAKGTPANVKFGSVYHHSLGMSGRAVRRLEVALDEMQEEKMETFVSNMAPGKAYEWFEVLLRTAEKIVVYQRQEAEIVARYLAQKEMIRKCKKELIKAVKKERRSLSEVDVLKEDQEGKKYGMLSEISAWCSKREAEIADWCQKWNFKI